MEKISRRQALTAASAAAVGAAITGLVAGRQSKGALAAIDPVVIVGGGMAGATVAKYIRFWGAKQIPVTLIDTNPSYISNIMSNLVLTGTKTLSSLTYTYSTLAGSTYGVKVIRGTVTGADFGLKKVTYQPPTGSPVTIPYSRLVVAPGIDFLPFNAAGRPTLVDPNNKVLHAWQAYARKTASPTSAYQVDDLRAQLVAMPQNGTFILTIPAKPYRCPPGPYERAALVADWIKKNRRSVGYANPQVIVLDANTGITAEPTNFGNAFNVVHAGVVKYVPNAALSSVDASGATTKVTVNLPVGSPELPAGGSKEYIGHVVNLIPDHQAGKIARDLGLNVASNGTVGRWCPVNVLSYESTALGMSGMGVHVVGDSQGSANQPKAGHIGSQEGKICADAIVRALLNSQQPDPAPITNSACYSPITYPTGTIPGTASWLSVEFKYDSGSGNMVVTGKNLDGTPATAATEATSISSGNYSQMNTWFSVLMGDVFK